MDCIFCKIINGEIPGKFVYRDSEILAIHDISPKAPVHVLIVPVKHVKSLQEVDQGDEVLLGKLLMTVPKIAKKLGILEDGFKIVINNGSASGQLVNHLHLHLLGGWRAKMHWEV